jgi:hypothetical protein
MGLFHFIYCFTSVTDTLADSQGERIKNFSFVLCP